MFELPKPMVLDEKSHQYSIDGKPLISVTKFLSQFEPEFDAEKISYFVARKQLRDEISEEPSEEAINARKKIVLADWESRRDDAANHGNNVHTMMEKFFNEQEVIFPGTEKYLMGLKKEYDAIYKEYRCEVMVYNEEFGLGGKMDIPLLRNCKTPVLDIEDFKSNLHKGIYFDSITRKDKIKHVNDFWKFPLSHIENCNYNRYALQLSLYAYLCEKLWNVKIGRLAIRWIDFDSETFQIRFATMIPVPYLRTDVALICSENAKKGSAIVLNNDDDEWT